MLFLGFLVVLFLDPFLFCQDFERCATDYGLASFACLKASLYESEGQYTGPQSRVITRSNKACRAASGDSGVL